MNRFAPISPLLMALALGACGCRVSAPKPQARTPVAMPSAWVAPATAGAVSVETWWAGFGATGLTLAVEESLANNHDLKSAAARLEAAVAQARIAGASASPRVGFDFNASRQERNFIGLPIPGAGDRVLTSRSTSYGATFSASWELDLWGRIRTGRQAALAEVQASVADMAAVRLSLAAQTAKAWLALAETRQQLALAERTRESFARTTAQIRRRYENGLTEGQTELRLALANEAAARAAVADCQSLLERTVRQLEILLGRYPKGVVGSDLVLPEPPPSVPAGLPAEILERRPDLIAAERRLTAADARLRQAKAALYPRISLTASGGTSTRELLDLLDLDYKIWTIAANVTQPLFEGGRLRAEVDQARARAEQAVAEYGRAVLHAFSEVEIRLAVAGPLDRREAELTEALNQAQASLRLAQERYASGLENYLTVLAAQRQIYTAESQRLSVRRMILENRVDLHLALGGGFAPVMPANDQATKSFIPTANP